MNSFKPLLVAASILISICTQAMNYYLDPMKGSDGAQGTETTPFKTLKYALKKLTPGDNLHFIPGKNPWRGIINLYGMTGGESGKPITIDGHGLQVTGADLCTPTSWTKAENGLWVHSGMNYTHILIVDGKMVFETIDNNVLQPGEVCYIEKLSKRLFYKPTGKTIPTMEAGQPDGSSVTLDPKNWQYSNFPGIKRYNGLKRPTWIKINNKKVVLVTARKRLKPGQFCLVNKKLYYNPPAGKSPSDMTIEAVVRTNGIQLNGQTHDVIIKNFNVQHVANDGYNIHGKVKRIEFYNCNAHDCGDEGFSSHSTCETLLDGAVYINCDNGINNVHKTKSISRNIICANSRHNGYEGQAESQHTVENMILIDNQRQLCFSGGSFNGKNILILRTEKGPKTTAIDGTNNIQLNGVTIINNTTLTRLIGKMNVLIENGLIGSNQGILHIRSDQPCKTFKLKNVNLGNNITVEWNTRYPFKRQPIAEWLKTAGMHNTTIIDTNDLTLLTKGQMPAKLPKTGCSIELLKKAVDFMKR